MGTDADVIVVGAGPAGSSLALMLARRSLHTILLDRSIFPRDKPCGEGLMPSGTRVLMDLGIPMDGFPQLAGVTYRVPGSGSVVGAFAGDVAGRGTRRLLLDRLLVDTAASEPAVDVQLGCEVRRIEPRPHGVLVHTAHGEVRSRFVVAADGARSGIIRAAGWARPPASQRFALVGHVDAAGHGFDRIVVTLLDDCEVYLAPSGPDELLVAILGIKGRLRRPGEPVREAYARRLGEAHPELSPAFRTRLRGAGPFWIRPSRVAEGRVFALGDAAGFTDPLTGDGMSAGLVAARQLAAILAGDHARPAEMYRRWEIRQWRRRVFMARLALALTGSRPAARLALRGLRRRPTTLSRLLEVNDGSRGRLALSLRDWAALTGI